MHQYLLQILFTYRLECHAFTFLAIIVDVLYSKSLNWSSKCRIISVFPFRLMNAALEAKTADIVEQADHLMVRFMMHHKSESGEINAPSA